MIEYHDHGHQHFKELHVPYRVCKTPVPLPTAQESPP